MYYNRSRMLEAQQESAREAAKEASGPGPPTNLRSPVGARKVRDGVSPSLLRSGADHAGDGKLLVTTEMFWCFQYR